MVSHGRLFQQNILAAMHAFEEQEFDQGRFYMHCPKRSDHELCKVRLVTDKYLEECK